MLLFIQVAAYYVTSYARENYIVGGPRMPSSVRVHVANAVTA